MSRYQSSSSGQAPSLRNLIGLEISGTYKLIERLGTGSHNVYVARDMRDNSEYAAKVDTIVSGTADVENEYAVYNALNRAGQLPGIAKVHHYCNRGRFRAIIMELLDQPLRGLRNTDPPVVSLRLALSVGVDLLHILSRVHSRGYVHLDIKPSNIFFLNTSLSPIVRLINFSSAERYIDRWTCNHRPDEEDVFPSGNITYASLRTHARLTRSRADDLESLGYVLIEVCRGRLPWQVYMRTRCTPTHRSPAEPNLESADTLCERINRMKSDISFSDLCEGMPSEMISYFVHIHSLRFEAKPNYDYLIGLLQSALLREGSTSSSSQN